MASFTVETSANFQDIAYVWPLCSRVIKEHRHIFPRPMFDSITQNGRMNCSKIIPPGNRILDKDPLFSEDGPSPQL